MAAGWTAAERSQEEGMGVRTCLGMRWSFRKEIGFVKEMGEAEARAERVARRRMVGERIFDGWRLEVGGRRLGWRSRPQRRVSARWMRDRLTLEA